MKTNNIRLIVELILIGICIVLFLLLTRSCDKVSEQKGLLIDLNDTLRVSRNELGEQTAKINILEMERSKDFLKLKTNDSTIFKLQNAVEKYKGDLASATVGSTETGIVGSGETVIIHDTDIVYINDTAYVYPKYESSWENKWELGHIIASKDSVWRSIKVKNEFELTYGEVKKGLFKPKVLEVSLTNKNPNTVTKELRTFSIKQKPKRFVVSAQLGYGIGLIDFKPQPMISLGFGYVLIGVK